MSEFADSVSSPKKISLGDRILRVNHAGEQGAICIYTGQLFAARLTASWMRGELHAFREDERRHRQIFQDELSRRGRRRCRSYWLCAAGGFTLGMMTGLLGSRAIATTTMAVEQVVLHHLERQIAVLAGSDDAAVVAIEAVIADEREHRDVSEKMVHQRSIVSRTLVALVSLSTEAVIWLGMKL
jgi:ubiquinone biosynthesis monooxygenase Coq7